MIIENDAGAERICCGAAVRGCNMNAPAVQAEAQSAAERVADFIFEVGGGRLSARKLLCSVLCFGMKIL